MRELVKCPDCGAAMQIADVESLVPHLAAHGLVGLTPVILHATPLCDTWQQRHDRAFEDAEHMVTDVREREERQREEDEETKNKRVK